MTKLEGVLAEQWSVGRGEHERTYGAEAGRGGLVVDGETVATFGQFDYGCASDPSIDLEVLERDELRLRVSVLGKRALALILKHEWCGDYSLDEEESVQCCPECDGMKPSFGVPPRYEDRAPPEGHAAGCEWGAICEESRRLG